MQWTGNPTPGPRGGSRPRRRGQALLEYGLILSLVSVSAIGALVSLGTSVSNLYTANAATIRTALDGR
jgi:Flp pilus assembly pilin Flp